MSDDASTQLTVRSPLGADVSLRVDDAVTEGVGASVEGEDLTVLSTAGSHSYVLSRSSSLPGAAYTVLFDRSSSTVQRFSVAVDGQPASLKQSADGSVMVLDVHGQTHNAIKPPWARDIKGNRVDTRYSIDGSTLVQTTDLTGDEVFPVVVDPGIACDWLFCTIEYDRGLTNWVATYGNVPATAITAGCSLLIIAAGWPAAVCGAMFGGMSSWIISTASDANNQGKCLGIRALIYRADATMHPAIYSGSNCH